MKALLVTLALLPALCMSFRCPDGIHSDCCNTAEDCGKPFHCMYWTCPQQGERCQRNSDPECCTPESCKSQDPCLADVCVGKECRHNRIYGCCNEDKDCPDGYACTEKGGRCVPPKGINPAMFK